MGREKAILVREGVIVVIVIVSTLVCDVLYCVVVRVRRGNAQEGDNARS